LNDVLRERRATQVVITGISTSAGVESTARSAYDYGYNVVIVTDAVTDRDAENHRHSLESGVSPNQRDMQDQRSDGLVKATSRRLIADGRRRPQPT
jgi:nicotinamidase-related amidase